ncbi:MAG: PaaI family thioesterase [Promethearchaeota archaeon]|nr:MAG: PaaI family thioesterase [Candidatus Lokiarchaeota archaeon]
MDDLKASLIDRIPFYRTLGFKLIEIKDGHAHFEMDIREALTQNGMIHGGVLASMIDSTCACAAFSLIYPEGWVTTIDLQVSYLKPVSKGTLIAKAECLRSGKNISFCESKIYNDKGELICIGTSQLLKVATKKT